MQQPSKLLNIASAFPEPNIDIETDVEMQDPMQQRREVLYVFSDIYNNFMLFFQDMLMSGFDPARLLTQDNNDISTVAGLNDYQTNKLVFNTRFQAHPFAIAMCQTSEEVQLAFQKAVAHNLPIRIRAGGHDHEGESSGDNTVVIDVTGLKDFAYDKDTHIVTLGAGYRFYQLTPKLAKLDRMIAHGTCATVGLAGFIQGGGWGPWTRKYGMCCEHLVGAKVVLGNGKLVNVSEDENPDILWALRGGGGMSWGIVTELRIKTFELPDEIHRFEIEWNKPSTAKLLKGCPQPQEQFTTYQVLDAWEKVINSDSTKELLGTNLKVNGLPKPCDVDVMDLHHHCLMFGYWEGTEKELLAFIKAEFKDVLSDQVEIRIGPASGKNPSVGKPGYEHNLMGEWARNSIADVSKYVGGVPGQTALLQGTPFTPDYDAPAPHKITSRLVSKAGITPDTGYRQFLESLTSELIQPQNEHLGLFSYVTLGAIAGEFYQKLNEPEGAVGVSFPYRDCQYTIQYQTWWNESIKNKIELQNNPVYVDTNRAMDWIQEGRDAEIGGTYGAFISFKDASVPTETYFQQNYHRLVEVKKEQIKDTYNHFRIRKSII